jgi:hypothetical protein
MEGDTLHKLTEPEGRKGIKDCRECTMTKNSQSLAERSHRRTASVLLPQRNPVDVRGIFGAQRGEQLHRQTKTWIGLSLEMFNSAEFQYLIERNGDWQI